MRLVISRQLYITISLSSNVYQSVHYIDTHVVYIDQKISAIYVTLPGAIHQKCIVSVYV